MPDTLLPAAAYFSDPARTNGQAKQAQDDMLAYLRERFGNTDGTLMVARPVDFGGQNLSNSPDLLPRGAIVMMATSTLPSGFLKCNGAAVGRAAYAALFGVINTFWGAGDGSTTFNVPDLRGEFLRAWDDGRGVDSGRTFGSHQFDALQNFSGWIRSAWTGGGSIDGAFTGYGSSTNNKPGTGGGPTFDIAFSPGPGGARVATETRPRNYSLLTCIKY
ncbi:tail fiber protein [Marivibrio halodurans]|uniref:Tail fiber protein n=1 Tax=Marivibrio halodurans TaxID=2039722 RepID=A0A8J7SMZ4_9PROT|nr:phage tail protein [Marivibrio halodurans]MBP5857301.1 tail fiber protein [Marivibrio halodurans]